MHSLTDQLRLSSSGDLSQLHRQRSLTKLGPVSPTPLARKITAPKVTLDWLMPKLLKTSSSQPLEHTGYVHAAEASVYIVPLFGAPVGFVCMQAFSPVSKVMKG